VFLAISASNVNLGRIFFVFRIFFSIAAAAVATIFAGIFSVSICIFIMFILGRRLRRCDALSSFLFFD
jgi:hypothetical protein